MATSSQQTLFALDCGATNWRLYRLEYQSTGVGVSLVGEPQASPLTSFNERKLPAIICLNPEGNALESFGEVAQGQLENEQTRGQVREYFKPCIGAHLEQKPLPHQKRYTHAQAVLYTGMLLEAVLAQIRLEKWRGQDFDDRLWFTIAYPIHWRYEHEGKIFTEYQQMVQERFGEAFRQIRFVAEPEGAILALQQRGLLTPEHQGGISLIIDVGGSTTDIIAGEVEAETGRLNFLGRYGEPFGGGLYDAELAKYISDEMKIPASVIADDPSAMISLRVAGQRLKESLSRQLSFSGRLSHTPQRTITMVMQDGSVYRRTIQLDEERFKEITHQLDEEFKNLIERALKNFSFASDRISQIVLVGGGSQLFTVTQHLRERFGQDRILLADNPEEVVVQGIGLEYRASFEKSEPTIVYPVEAQPEAHAPKAAGWLLLDGNGHSSKLQSGITRLGRGEGNEIQVDDLKASRFHAEISLNEAHLAIVDVGSTNGTFLNGERLRAHEPYSLHVKDTIAIGKIVFEVTKKE